MPKEKQQGLSNKEKEKLLTVLEKDGKEKWFKRWKEHMAIPGNLDVASRNKDEQEKVLRYLLLRVLINQQARFEKVKEMSIKISEEFKDILFLEPFRIPEDELFNLFKKIAGEKGSALYRVGALGGIKPISLFSYRFKAYEGFIRWLERKGINLIDIVVKELKNYGTIGLFKFLNTHSVLEAGWVGNDPKACRMFVNWVVFLFCEIWEQGITKMEDTFMIVDGHVGKVFCRSGLIDEVLYEKRRPYIIQASKMRAWIEEIVSNFGKIPFYVDNGAFYLFEDGRCAEANPNCIKCPVNKICKKYIKWTAYRMFEK